MTCRARVEPSLASAGNIRVQRKCACGAKAAEHGSCERCANDHVQRKLVIGSANSPLEAEAERVADAVMRDDAMPIAASHRKSSSPSARRSASPVPSSAKESPAPDVVHKVIERPGRPLDDAARRFLEPRFGRDFGDVRIHADAEAASSARAIDASAYTVGNHVVFGAGRYAPATASGRHLLAHELTHVVQGGSPTHRKVRRQREEIEQAGKEIADMAEEEVRQQLRAIAAMPGTGALYTNPDCKSPNFCNPFKDVRAATMLRTALWPLFRMGIAKKVNSKVVPLWKDYLFGGSAPQNITSGFAAEFTSSKTTAETTEFIAAQLKKEIARNHRAIMGSAASLTVDLTPRMSNTLAAIDNPKHKHAMNFNKIGETAGNIAGGIGKDQTSHKIGALPSPFNDERSATISATLTRAGGKLHVEPQIAYTVRDTIDLCPGNCGAGTEQDATIPLSRFEATGLSGDVPFTVEFPAPTSALGPFDISIGGGSKKPAKTPGPAKGPSPAKGALVPAPKTGFNSKNPHDGAQLGWLAPEEEADAEIFDNGENVTGMFEEEDESLAS